MLKIEVDGEWVDLTTVPGRPSAQELVVTGDRESLEDIARLPELRGVRVKGRVSAAELARLVSRGLSVLHVLHLTAQLGGVIERMGDMSRLYVRATSDQGAKALIRLDLSALASVHELALEVEQGFRPAEPAAYRWLSRMPRLRRLELTGFELDELCLEDVFALQGLERLELSYVDRACHKRLVQAHPNAFVDVRDPFRLCSEPEPGPVGPVGPLTLEQCVWVDETAIPSPDGRDWSLTAYLAEMFDTDVESDAFERLAAHLAAHHPRLLEGLYMSHEGDSTWMTSHRRESLDELREIILDLARQRRA